MANVQRSTFGVLCRTLVGQTDFEAWSAFTSADWERLVRTAQAHDVAPLLYHALSEAGWPADILSSVQADLRQAYHTTAARNLVIYQELVRILTTLRVSPSPPLPVILLKGAALAATLYPNIGLRPMGDLDLLVPEHQLDQAVEAVKSLGYVPEAKDKRPEIRSGLARLTSYEVNFDGGEHIPVHVELHWNLIGGEESRYRPRIKWFWEQTEEYQGIREKGKKEQGSKGRREQGNKGTREEVVGKEQEGPFPTYSLFDLFPSQLIPFSTSQLFPSSALQLTPTAHLLYLAAHLALKHGEAQAYLRWFYDIHLLVTREGHRIDWEELMLRAEEFRWGAALHAALRGAQDRFATPLPNGFLETLAKIQDPQAARLIKRKTTVQTRAARTWDSLMSLSWPARLRLAWALAFPRPAYMRWRYEPRPAWLWPLYYPYRWFDILRDGLATLWRIVRRG